MTPIARYISATILVFFAAIGCWNLFSYVYRCSFQAQPLATAMIDGNAGIKHIAFIMDGNRRWAKAQHMKPWFGHQGGVNPIKEAVRFCCSHDISVLSLYAFSLENFNRSAEELDHLFDVIEHGLTREDLTELASNGVRIRFIGDCSRFPQRLLDTIHRIETATAAGGKVVVNLLFCYGGRQEICAAVKRIARRVAQKELDPENIDEKSVESELWLGDCSAPDLIVRTGGEQRLSNFMAWQSCYSELLFIDTFWPAMTRADFESVLSIYAQRKRNFGR